jgi:hypothetical protein
MHAASCPANSLPAGPLPGRAGTYASALRPARIWTGPNGPTVYWYADSRERTNHPEDARSGPRYWTAGESPSSSNEGWQPGGTGQPAPDFAGELDDLLGDTGWESDADTYGLDFTLTCPHGRQLESDADGCGRPDCRNPLRAAGMI